MFDHVTIGTSDRDASRAFYAAVLPVLGLTPTDDPAYVEWGEWSVAQAGPGRPVTRGLHVGFAAADRAAVDAFWRAGVDAGYASDGEPGPRPEYLPDYYGAFLLDPDGNSIEAVVHGDLRDRPGAIDHLWVRVADRAACAAFYRACGLPVAGEKPGRTTFSPGEHRGSMSLVDAGADEPTTPFHLAFPAASRADVDAWHAAVTAAGFPSHGAPGERPVYHPGYYGAFALDPAGHNAESIHHTRGQS